VSANFELRIDPLPRQGVVGVLNEALNVLGLVNMEGRRRRHQTWLRGRSSAAAFEDGPA
jgi:hypothetical protein